MMLELVLGILMIAGGLGLVIHGPDQLVQLAGAGFSAFGLRELILVGAYYFYGHHK